MQSKPIFISIIVVLGVVCLGLLIAVIVLGAQSVAGDSSDPKTHDDLVKFTEFSADTVSVNFYGDLLSFHESTREKEVVYDDSKWYTEVIEEGEVTSISFTNGGINSVTGCMHLPSHDHCFVRSFSGEGGFHIPYEAQLVESYTPCKELAPLVSQNPTRNLTMCKKYSVASESSLVEFVVEQDNEYPVQTMVTTFDWTGAYSNFKIYMTFDPKKPKEDKSKLKPWEGVTVYDFRNGGGDAGDGKSNVISRENSVQASVGGPQQRGIEILFETIKKHSGMDDAAIRRLAVRDFLHLPPASFTGMYSLPVNKTQVRAFRDIPPSFDARQHWVDCKDVIGTITNQGMCGSCWAMSSTGVLSDRLCISSGQKVQLSPQYLMQCSYANSLCQGGEARHCWNDLMKVGTVPEACVPFEARFNVCPSRCQNGDAIDESMKVYPSSFVMPWGPTAEERVKAIQTEIMANGPVQAYYWTFDDFNTFFEENPQGIYHRSVGAVFGGGHAVRIIGWGTEDNQDFWLVANSWGKEFADEGVFKIRRGNNECDFEEIVAAGILS